MMITLTILVLILLNPFENIAFEFQSSKGKISRSTDVVTDIIVYCLNKQTKNNKNNHLIIMNQDGNSIKKLNINWSDSYGVVDLEGKWINNNFEGFDHTNTFSDDFEFYVRGILTIPEDRTKFLTNKSLLIDKIWSQNIPIHYFKDSPDLFNAIKINKYKSLKLSIVGNECLILTSQAMKTYKLFINNDYFLFGFLNIDIEKIKKLFFFRKEKQCCIELDTTI